MLTVAERRKGLGMSEHTDVVVALDVGGTSVKAALVDDRGRMSAETRRPTGVGSGVAAVVDGFVEIIEGLIKESGEGFGSPVAIGLGVPGVVDAEAGIARYAANVGWRNLPLVTMLHDRFALPVALGHDVRCAGLAEARVGAGAGVDSSFFLSIGTGIAGASARYGQMESGSTGQAGEVGHLIVRPGGPLCGCGNRGCLEAISSASRIAERYSKARGSRFTAQQVVEQVRGGDSLAIQVWNEAMDALADALAAVTVLTDPGRVVIGGGLSLAGDTLIEPLARMLPTRLMFRSPPTLAVTELGDRAGAIGAGLLAWDLMAGSDPLGDRRK